MTPPDLVTLLDLVALALGRVADGSTTPISDLSEAAAGIAQVRAALLASPPEVPAALVALVLEWQEAWAYVVANGRKRNTATRLLDAEDALMAWTPPAASGPPAAPPETVKECAWLVETHILSHLHYLRSWNVRHSKPEWTSNIDEAWRFARREDADKALVYLAAGEGRVAEHLWVPLHAPPVVVPEAPAPPEIDTPEVRRAD